MAVNVIITTVLLAVFVHGEGSLTWLSHNCHKIQHSSFKSFIFHKMISAGRQNGPNTALTKGQMCSSSVPCFTNSSLHHRAVKRMEAITVWAVLYSPVIVPGNDTSVGGVRSARI